MSKKLLPALFLLALITSCAAEKNAIEQEETLVDEYPSSFELTNIRQPYLQNVNHNSVTVMWESEEDCLGAVEWWSGANYGYIAETEQALRHEVIVEGFNDNDQNAAYRYRCIRGDYDQDPAEIKRAVVGELTPFKLAPAPEDAYRLAIYGDNRSLPLMHKSVVDRIIENEPGLVINVGDVVADGNNYESWGPQFFDPISALAKSVPFFVAIGNHENNSSNFYELLAQPGTENYFAFEYGNSYNIVIDSNFPTIAPETEMMVWFEQELNSIAAQSADWLFVYAHHPPYSEGWDSPGYDGDAVVRQFAAPMIAEAGADIYFAGHTHDYERGELDDVVWIITGGGGASLDSFQQDFEHITVYESAWHFVSLDIEGSILDLKAIDLDGRVIDQIQIDKR